MKLSAPHGVVVPMISPLSASGECDARSVSRLVEHLITHGVDCLMVAGTTGESLALSKETRCRLVEATCEAAAGRVQVMVGIGAACLEDVLDLSRHAAEAGADLVSLHPPPYFPLDESSLRNFYDAVIEASPLPMALYTIPSFAVNRLSPELVSELVAHPKVVALKDSTGDPQYRRDVIAHCSPHGVGVLAGDEFSLVNAARDGVVGIVPSTANLRPAEFVKLWQLCTQRDWTVAEELQKQLNAPVGEILTRHGGWLGMIRWLKGSLAAKGLCEARLASLFAANPEGVAL